MVPIFSLYKLLESQKRSKYNKKQRKTISSLTYETDFPCDQNFFSLNYLKVKEGQSIIKKH